MRAARATIHLNALRRNLQRAREAAPGSRVMAAIKANGYGHGLERVANALSEADAFGVACLEEAQQLRSAGIEQPITLLEGFFSADEIPAIAELQLEVVLHHRHQIDALLESDYRDSLTVWLKVDTGMHRIGFPPDQLATVWRAIANAGANIRGCMTHLACADERHNPMTEEQIRLFEAACSGIPGERAIANSAGVLGWSQSHADWVRPGIMLYGVSPFINGRAAEERLEPVMTLSSSLIAVNEIEAGECVGYGSTWCAPETMPVGVVAMGYGDGYPRHAPSGTPVLVNGHRVPLIGRVSMDMLSVDLRGYPEARVGDPVVLWGQGLAIEEIAERAGTIAYELLCGITQRLQWVEEDSD